MLMPKSTTVLPRPQAVQLIHDEDEEQEAAARAASTTPPPPPPPKFILSGIAREVTAQNTTLLVSMKN